MSTTDMMPTPTGAGQGTVADLLAQFGPIPHQRIRTLPYPGVATEKDVIDLNQRENRLYELVDGVLVEKAMGVQESYLAVLIAQMLWDFVRPHDLGFVLGSDGMARLAPGLVRIPDVSFISWKRVPERRIPKIAMLGFGPDLAVEVLSPSNTKKEMERKLNDYFAAAVQLVWFVDPADRSVQVFRAVDKSYVVRQDQTLTGDPLLPGLAISLKELFSSLEP